MTKVNKISDAVKFLILAATIVVVCILCAVGFKMANEGKSSVASGTNKYNEMVSGQDDSEYTAYDGNTVLGSQLADLIKQTIDSNKFLGIRVKTTAGNENGVCYNYELNPKDGEDGERYEPKEIENKEYATMDKMNPEYINPFSLFYGKTLKDLNGNIIGLEFTQE